MIVLLCFAADLALGLIFLVDASFGEPTRLFDLEEEANVPAWYASAQLLVVALLLGLYASVHFERSKMDAWLLATLPLVFLGLSIDETAGIHEWIGYRTDALLPGGSRDNTLFEKTGIWMIVLGLPFVAFIFFAFRRLRHYCRPVSVRLRYATGFILFVSGAVGVEVAVNFVETDSQAHVVQVLLEEMLEMVGVTTMLWATWTLVGTAVPIFARHDEASLAFRAASRRS